MDDDLVVLDAIPFTLDAAALRERLHVPPGGEDAEAFTRLVDLAQDVGRPKAAYCEAFVVSRSEETVGIGEVVFTSRMLARNLEAAERLFAYVATCGLEADESYTDEGDILQAFWWDGIKRRMLQAAVLHLAAHLDKTYRLGKTATMAPGSGDATVWPIEQQRELFALLGDVTGAIGVTLTDSCLMVPNKTISGVRFATEADYRSCQVCHREACPSRSAPFDEELWQELQHA